MKSFFFVICFLLIGGYMNAQTDTTQQAPNAVIYDSTGAPPLVVDERGKAPKKKYNLTNRANDHFLLQLGYANWMDAPDSIKTGGLSRSINAYLMLDFPFKSSPQLSVAVGLGVGSDHIFLDNNFADVKGKTTTLRFADTTGLAIKKTKVATAYLEAPFELRFVSNPEQSDKSFKIAIGVKAGMLVKSGTRSRITTEESQPNFLLKEASKTYFNTTRIVGTGRIGFGHFTLFGTYQFTSLLKTGAGPQLKPYTIGLSLGGL